MGMLRMDDPAVDGDLKRVYATHAAQHKGKAKFAFLKAAHALHRAGHGHAAAVRVGHLAAKRVAAKHDGTPKPIQRAAGFTFKKKGH